MPRRHPFVLAGSVSRVLYSAARFRCGAPVIYLRRRSPAASSNLPPDIGRATLNCRYTRSCNPSDVRPATSLPPRWALTPPFHPYRPKDGGCFLSHCSAIADSFPLGNMALCVARTFLLPHKNGKRQDAVLFYYCKINKNSTENKAFVRQKVRGTPLLPSPPPLYGCRNAKCRCLSNCFSGCRLWKNRACRPRLCAARCV